MLIDGVVFLCAGLLLSASIGTIRAETITVAGTKHDLSANSSIKGADDPCLYCHAKPDPAKSEYLLSRTETSKTFTLYSSTRMKAAVEQPGSASRFCMSCHDGSTPFDALHGSKGTANNDMMSVYPDTTSIVGTDLSDLHPIGIEMSLEIPGINDLLTSTGLQLIDGKIECTTCHEPHGKGGHTAMLRIDPANSALCLVCHEK